MTTSRRNFLQIAASAAIGTLALDPERELWVPGKKLISIPKPVPVGTTIFTRVPAQFIMQQRGVKVKAILSDGRTFDKILSNEEFRRLSMLNSRYGKFAIGDTIAL